MEELNTYKWIKADFRLTALAVAFGSSNAYQETFETVQAVK